MKFDKIIKELMIEGKYNSKHVYKIEGDVYLTILGAGAAMKMRNKKFPDLKPLKHVTDVPVKDLGWFDTDGKTFNSRKSKDSKEFVDSLPKDINIE